MRMMWLMRRIVSRCCKACKCITDEGIALVNYHEDRAGFRRR